MNARRSIERTESTCNRVSMSAFVFTSIGYQIESMPTKTRISFVIVNYYEKAKDDLFTKL